MKLNIKTPARLHFGLLNPTLDPPEKYGGFGVALKDMGFEMEVEKSDELRIGSDCGQRSRIKEVVEKLTEAYDISPDFKIDVRKAIPPHIGLGSTTQLTLALGRAMTVLLDRGRSPIKIAKDLSRGKRSGIGTYAFDRGGFLVEGGGGRDDFPQLVFRRKFPEDWCFLILTPDVETGPKEGVEDKFFEDLNSDSDIAGRICSEMVLETLPALVDGDIERFGGTLTRIDELAGSAFSSTQGGKFKNDVMGLIKSKLLDCGAYGVGQSSWGPTIYALTGGLDRSQDIRDEMVDFFEDEGFSGKISVERVDNSGAFLEVID